MDKTIITALAIVAILGIVVGAVSVLSIPLQTVNAQELRPDEPIIGPIKFLEQELQRVEPIIKEEQKKIEPIIIVLKDVIISN